MQTDFNFIFSLYSNLIKSSYKMIVILITSQIDENTYLLTHPFINLRPFDLSTYLPLLPIYLPIYLLVYLSIYLLTFATYLFTYLLIYLSIDLPTFATYLSTYLMTYLPLLPTYLPTHPSSYLPLRRSLCCSFFAI
jgi:hypothetical protein